MAGYTKAHTGHTKYSKSAGGQGGGKVSPAQLMTGQARVVNGKVTKDPGNLKGGKGKGPC